jgi:hypothetical protein
METIPARDALDREDVGAVVADRQSQARIDSPTVDQDGTGAALAAVTSLFGSCQMQAFAQEIQQSDAGVFEFEVPPHPVNGEADGEIHAELRSVLKSDQDCTAGIHRQACPDLTLLGIYGGVLRLARQDPTL